VDRGNTPLVSRFKRGRGCVVSDDASTEASRVSSEGGGVSLVMHRQRKHPPPSRVSSEGGGVLLVVMCRQKKHPLRLVFGTREGVEAATRRRD